MKRSRRRETPAEYIARQEFNEAVCEHPCFFTERLGHECDGPLDAHHLVPKSFLRQRLSDWPEKRLLEVMYSPLIGAPLCRLAHHLVEVRSDYIFWDQLSPECLEFVSSLPEFVLMRLELESPKRSDKEAA